MTCTLGRKAGGASHPERKTAATSFRKTTITLLAAVTLASAALDAQPMVAGAAAGDPGLINLSEGSDGLSGFPAASADGSIVVFESDAKNLSPDDDNVSTDIFVWERASDTLTNITNGEDDSLSADVSADGSTVVFVSDANDLTQDDDNNRRDVFTWDRQSGVITNITDGANGNSFSASISTSGEFIAFDTTANNLAPGDGNDNRRDVLVWERSTGAFTNVTADASSGSEFPDISDDGSTVAFASLAALTLGDTNDMTDVFVWNRLTEEMRNLSPNGDKASRHASISGNARLVTFHSDATNLVDDDTNNARDVFTWFDLNGGQLFNITINANNSSEQPNVSGNGLTITFHSDAFNLVGGDTNGSRDVFLWDAVSATVTNVTMGGNQNSFAGAMSGDGSVLTFYSFAFNLTDDDNNGIRDVFAWVRPQDTSPPEVTFTNPIVDGSTPQTASGTVTDSGSGVNRMEIIAVDLGAAGASGIPDTQLSWWNGSEWSDTRTTLEADISGDQWTFTWSPVAGGSGSFAIGLTAFDRAGNKWPVGKPTQAIVVISDTTRPTVTGEQPNVSGDEITWQGTANEDVAIRKVRMIVRHVETNSYWNGTDWIPAAQTVGDASILLHTELSEPLAQTPGWSYTLETDRSGTFQTHTWAQNGAYRYSTPASSQVSKN